MFIQTQKTPNPNSLKFLTGRKVSLDGPYEILDKNDTNNSLIKNLLSINGVAGLFLGEDFLTVNKNENIQWEDIQHIIISYVNEFYAEGNQFIIDKINEEKLEENLGEIEEKIKKLLETKIRPAVSKDGGDIKFKNFKDGKVVVELQGSCSGCPSSTCLLYTSPSPRD